MLRRASSRVISMPSAARAIEGIGLDQRELVAAAASGKRARSVRVAVAEQTAARDRVRFADARERRLRGRCHEQPRTTASCGSRAARTAARRRGSGRKARRATASVSTPPSTRSPTGSRIGPEGTPNISTAPRRPAPSDRRGDPVAGPRERRRDRRRERGRGSGRRATGARRRPALRPARGSCCGSMPSAAARQTGKPGSAPIMSAAYARAQSICDRWCATTTLPSRWPPSRRGFSVARCRSPTSRRSASGCSPTGTRRRAVRRTSP